MNRNSAIALGLIACGLLAQRDSGRLQLSDLPISAKGALAEAATSPYAFDRYLDELDAETERRVQEGDWDALVYYVLQSDAFTSLPPIEPADSAKGSFAADGGRAIPLAVRNRIEAFCTAEPKAERHRELRSVVADNPDPPRRIAREYRRAMRFLYEKEVDSLNRDGEERRQFVASLYQHRGYSSDTGVDAAFTTHAGLAYLREVQPEFRVRRAIVIGPGLDFSPRTSLREDHPPQSPQPYLLLDSLLATGLSERDSVAIRCFDVNPRVIRYLKTPPRTLHLTWQPGEPEHRVFFEAAGSRIGRPVLDQDLAGRLTARRLNIVTEYEPGEPSAELAVATNVFLYFSDAELFLALANIRAMLGPGGILMHNDPRGAVVQFGRDLGLPVIHARTVRLPGSGTRELYDTVAIHRVAD